MAVEGTTIDNNQAGGNDADQGGGGLYNDGGTIGVKGSQIDSNSATGTSGSGGGVLNNGGDLALAGSAVTSNDSSAQAVGSRPTSARSAWSTSG